MSHPRIATSVGLAGLAVIAISGSDWLLTWLVVLVAVLACGALLWETRHE